jgi:hypothetical protein
VPQVSIFSPGFLCRTERCQPRRSPNSTGSVRPSTLLCLANSIISVVRHASSPGTAIGSIPVIRIVKQCRVGLTRFDHDVGIVPPKLKRNDAVHLDRSTVNERVLLL